MSTDPPPTRKLTIVAKDPGLRLGGAKGPMAFVQVPVPAEILAKGPTGYRIKVVDYNATEQIAYADEQNYQHSNGELIDPFEPRPPETIYSPAYQARCIANPNFHAQNVYAIAMRTLGAFERALGRRVGWSSGGHQLHIAPHAFGMANAFYSDQDRAMLFGYFHRANGEPIFTCLSHDIVAHETTHALLDGLRSRYTEASGPDQSAFHEGFADIVALLSVFSLEAVVAAAIGEDGTYVEGAKKKNISLVKASKLSAAAIKRSILLGLAREVGSELQSDARGALRRSVDLSPAEGVVMRNGDDEHDRGEVLAAAMMNSFVELWTDRIATLGRFPGNCYNLGSAVAEGTKVAGHLLNMSIRALDYCPPTDIDFSQYLAALLTADRELVPDDSEHGYRAAIRRSFKAYGITVPQTGCDQDGCWSRFEQSSNLTYARSNYAAMTRSPEELFRFLWENRTALKISDRAYTEVLSIDPVARTGPDGITLHETVCQYVQRADIFGSEFQSMLGAPRPDGMKTTDRFTAHGGGVLVLDQYGQVKYHIANPILDGPRQRTRGEYLVDTGQIGDTNAANRLRFALAHQHRMGA